MKKGLTLVEVILAVSILAVLLSLGTVVFNSFARKDQVLVEAREIEALLSEARAKTLAGFSLGEGESLNFGVYFQSDRYVFFPGTTYDPGHESNQAFLLPESLEIAPIFLPSNSVVFEKITGEVRGFDPDENYLVVSDKQSDERKKVSISRLGVVKVEGF